MTMNPVGVRRLMICGLAGVLLSLGAFTTVATAEDGGRFVGRVAVEWLDEDGGSRNMRLLEDFSFVDPAGKTWMVPEGAIINGASIPRAFWSAIGPPFVGAYRRASVIHDYYCETMSEPWKTVHWMFYEASVAAGVDEVTAKMMYAALYGAGPRWEETTSGERAGKPRRLPAPQLDEASMKALEDWIRAEDPSLEAVETRIDRMLGPIRPTSQAQP